MLHGRLQLHDVRLDTVCAMDLLRAKMLKLFDEVLDSLFVQLLCLLILVHQVLGQAALLLILDLKHAHLLLLFLLASFLGAHCLLELADLNRLHVNGVLQLQGLLLQKEVRIPGIVKLSTQHQDFLLEDLVLPCGRHGHRCERGTSAATKSTICATKNGRTACHLRDIVLQCVQMVLLWHMHDRAIVEDHVCGIMTRLSTKVSIFKRLVHSRGYRSGLSS